MVQIIVTRAEILIISNDCVKFNASMFDNIFKHKLYISKNFGFDHELFICHEDNELIIGNYKYHTSINLTHPNSLNEKYLSAHIMTIYNYIASH